MSRLYLVVDEPGAWADRLPADAVITFPTYLKEHPRKGERNTRIINLCDTGRYLSRGYYCSLLAEARGHKVLPPVNTLTDLGARPLYLVQAAEVLRKLGRSAASSGQDTLTFRIFFGQTADPALQVLARRLFERLPCPILQVVMRWRQSWQIESVTPLSPAELGEDESEAFGDALEHFARHRWHRPRRSKRSRWDMAILVNREEKLPPSDARALKRIGKAAGKVGFQVEFIGPGDYARLGEFDALFIRETTGVDNHTYRFSRKAEMEGLVVMDDPTSILRCCNKVFLHDAFTYSGVPTLRTAFVSGSSTHDIDELEAQFGYPMVLKIPNSAFSVGVMKAENRAELKKMLTRLLDKSSLVLAQEFLYTEFDWRIGVLNNRPLYACRYYMANNHWQIYDHGEGRIGSGNWETLPTYEVPRAVLDAALKAARIIGDGLYGIDIKQQGNKVYVIEVNDNPSLEYGVEDAFLGEELYMQIMGEFARRLENRGRQA